MRFVTAIALASLTVPWLAQAKEEAPAKEAWEEGYLLGVIAGSMLTGNCDAVKKMMGEDLYLQGHHERCLGVIAFKASLEAEKKGETEKAAEHHQTFCNHYKTAQDFWQKKPLPAHGTEEDVKRRQGFLDEVISTREKRCHAASDAAPK